MNDILLLFIVSLAVSAIGWIYFIYFFSIGYGYSIVGLAITMLIMYKDAVTLPTAVLCVLLIIFGARLGTYLLIRGIKSKEYQKILYEPSLTEKKPFMVMFMVWFWCAVLYVAQVSPIAFRLMNTQAGTEVSDVWAWIGAAFVLGGILLESLSDAQKTASKKRDPKKFVSTGLYKIVRCPNYLGEVVIWTGAMLCGFGAGLSILQWILVLLGYMGIIYVMISGARRLEMRQNKAYQDDPEYKAYVQRTPILFPFVPLYSVEKYEWLKA